MMAVVAAPQSSHADEGGVSLWIPNSQPPAEPLAIRHSGLLGGALAGHADAAFDCADEGLPILDCRSQNCTKGIITVRDNRGAH